MKINNLFIISSLALLLYLLIFELPALALSWRFFIILIFVFLVSFFINLKQSVHIFEKNNDNRLDVFNIPPIDELKESIYSASNDAIVVANEKDIIVEFSPVAEKIFQWKRNEIIGKSMSETIIPPNMRKAHQRGMAHFIKTGEAPVLNQLLELTAISKDQQIFPIEISISAAKRDKGYLFVSYIRDISKRQYNETMLKISAQAFETLQPMFFTDSQGKIIETNPAFVDTTGYTARSLKGLLFKKFTFKGDFLKHKVWQDAKLKNKGNGEFALKHADGHLIPVYMTLISIKNKEDCIEHYIGHFFDLTKEKQNQANLLNAQYAAEHANAIKGRFLANMSHEIRTPMNGVVGILDLLKQTSLTEQQKNLINTAQCSSDLLLNIINDILDFSRLEANKLELENKPFFLHDVFNECIDILNTEVKKKKLDNSYSIQPDTPNYVVGDSERIRQIILNLLSNAIKYTKKGFIRVNLSCIEWHRQNSRILIQIEISDSGIGIEKNQLNTIFDEFSMIENSYNRQQQGSGLGLAICKQLVNLMQGKIFISSQLNEGSTFTVHIPLEKISHQTDEKKEVKDKKQRFKINKNIKILMVDDHPSNQMIMKTMMEFSGIKIEIVDNGKKAIEAVKNNHYDIIFMDISMPGMDGTEATKRIRALGKKEIVIIALTAHAILGDRERFLNSGMNDYISKPFIRDTILACIARWQPSVSISANTSSYRDDNQSDHISVIENNELTDDFSTHHSVNEKTLDQLIDDTSKEIVIELLSLYVLDAKIRIEKIKEAKNNKDYKAVEFQAHALSGAAAAHAHQAISDLCQLIETHCIKNENEKVVIYTNQLLEEADFYFEVLNEKILALQK